MTEDLKSKFEALRAAGKLVDVEKKTSMTVEAGKAMSAAFGEEFTTTLPNGHRITDLFFEGLFFPTEIIIEGELENVNYYVYFAYKCVASPDDFCLKPEQASTFPLKFTVNGKEWGYDKTLTPGTAVHVQLENKSQDSRSFDITVKGVEIHVPSADLSDLVLDCERCGKPTAQVPANPDAPSTLQGMVAADHECSHGKRCVTFGCHECENRAPGSLAIFVDTEFVDFRFGNYPANYVYHKTDRFVGAKVNFFSLRLYSTTARLEGELRVDGKAIPYEIEEIVTDENKPRLNSVKYKINDGKPVQTTKDIWFAVSDPNSTSPFVACDMSLEMFHDAVG